MKLGLFTSNPCSIFLHHKNLFKHNFILCPRAYNDSLSVSVFILSLLLICMVFPNLVLMCLFKFISWYFPIYTSPFASYTGTLDQEQVRNQQKPELGIRLNQWTLETLKGYAGNRLQLFQLQSILLLKACGKIESG